ncbi:hypothetical protein ACMBCM_06900, partial [Spiroplasma sp. K1]
VFRIWALWTTTFYRLLNWILQYLILFWVKLNLFLTYIHIYIYIYIYRWVPKEKWVHKLITG